MVSHYSFGILRPPRARVTSAIVSHYSFGILRPPRARVTPALVCHYSFGISVTGLFYISRSLLNFNILFSANGGSFGPLLTILREKTPILAVFWSYLANIKQYYKA